MVRRVSQQFGSVGSSWSPILFATSNPLKLAEAKALLPNVEGYECDLPEVQAIDVRDVIVAKLDILVELDVPVLVEDTGLCVPSLGGLPGALVKWFISGFGPERTAEMLIWAAGADELPAAAVSVVGAAVAGRTFFAVGETRGRLVPPRGSALGWNNIFQPEGSDLTFGEMSDTQRLRWSMRRGPLIEAAAWIASRSRDASE
jgi:inosine triphosphate pyrophosphatase